MNDIECMCCGKKTTNPKFCNLTCANKFNAAARKQKTIEKNTRSCLECGSDFYSKDSRVLRCSSSCGTKHGNRIKPRRGKIYRCAVMGCESISRRIRGDIFVCSKECRYIYLVQEWIAGRESGSSKYSYKPFVKQYLLETYGYRCTLCNICEDRPEVVEVLQLDHIDGHWDNNSPDNVRMLCPTCHALTDTYGAKNMGNGRTWKSKYNQYEPKNTIDRT